MVGQLLSHYRVVSPLGAGGMGVVYRAHDEQLDRDVALKVLPAHSLGDEAARVRLVREARLASKLNHPNICTIFEVGEAAPSAGSGQAVSFIAMELVEGQTLSARLASGALPVAEAARYGQQLADALAHAHERGVVHRDLKSANVVITPAGRAKVLDFGLAKPLQPEALTEAITLSHHSLTAPGAIVGTLAYMAPEQLRGQAADARSDIWALGVMLHEMVSGVRPFQGQTAYELSSAILNDTPPPLPAPAAALTGVVERCLAKEPGQRFQHSGDVTTALEAVQSGAATPPRVATPGRVGRRRWRLGLAAGAAALLVVVVASLALDLGGLRSRTVALWAGERRVRLAVLPFVNDSGDQAQEWFSDGQTSEITVQFARLHPASLEVIANTSMMHYKKTDKTPPQIASELGGVDYVLSGRARSDAKRFVIRVELIKVAGQSVVWTNSFDQDSAGIVVVQSQIASSVANVLALKLLAAEQARLSNVRAVNADAYNLCIKGSQLWPKLTRADLDAAQQDFEQALLRDPNYGPAYAGIAMVWLGRQQGGLVSPREAGPKAKAAAMAAVQLDDTIAEAHYALAVVKMVIDWDWAGADAEYQRAIALNPSSAEARTIYSHLLLSVRRPDEAMTQIEQALKLDPLNKLAHGFYTVDLAWVRRYDDAIVEGRKTLAKWPDAWIARSGLFMGLFAKRAYDEMLKSDREEIGDDRELREAYERGYREAGWPGAQKRLADVWAARARKSGDESGCWGVAVAYAYAGDKEGAIEWLGRAVAARDPALYGSGMPAFDIVRSDPRYQALLRRVGLPLQ